MPISTRSPSASDQTAPTQDGRSDLTESDARRIATHRHYKGGLYRKIGIARHSETLEDVVLYEHLWPHPRGLWVRPEPLFNGLLEDGRPRFELLSQESDIT